jgi:plasmid stability protein
MPALLIRGLPDEAHRKLKQLAQRNRRSLSAEAIWLLEQALAAQEKDAHWLPKPLEGAFPLSDEWLQNAKNEGRA